MSTTNFFDESTEQSQIKAEIVAKYFWAWAKVIMPAAERRRINRVAYVDLFAGPGRYKDGTKSTPLLILERAIQEPVMRERLITIFNDVNADHTQSLENAINDLEGVDSLRYKPQIHNEEVGTKIVEMFEQMKSIPTLVFIDPWGYKGLSLRLINSTLKDWGSECIIFFNYNRINMGLKNEAVREHMNALFGVEHADRLRAMLETMLPYQRELTIVEAISEALQRMGGEFVLPFRFKNAQGTRTSHHLIFVSKHVLGYEIMKDIMARESSSSQQGVPSFEYNSATRDQPILFELTRPLDELAEMLLGQFAGQTLKMVEIYRQHHIGRRYIKPNYKQVLTQLEAEGQITVDRPADKRRKYRGEVTFGDDILVTFPEK